MHHLNPNGKLQLGDLGGAMDLGEPLGRRLACGQNGRTLRWAVCGIFLVGKEPSWLIGAQVEQIGPATRVCILDPCSVVKGEARHLFLR